MTIEEAIKASKNGAIAASISGGLTLLLVVFAVTTNADGAIALWNDPLNFIDVGLLFLCAFGMVKNSRAAAVTIFIYFILARIGIAIETGSSSGIFVSLIFLYYYGKAIHGSFVYHKIKKAEDPDYRASPKWVSFVGIPVVAVFFGLVTLGILTETDVVPSTAVVRGAEIAPGDRLLLVENGVLYEDETVDYFYSYGIASVLEGGSILTERSVTMYFEEDDSVETYELLFAEIETVELVEAGDFWNDSIYRITGAGEENWLNIALSTEAEGDVNFVRALRRRVATSVRQPFAE